MYRVLDDGHVLTTAMYSLRRSYSLLTPYDILLRTACYDLVLDDDLVGREGRADPQDALLDRVQGLLVRVRVGA